MIKKQLKKELHKDAYVAPVATFYDVQMEGVVCGSEDGTTTESGRIVTLGWDSES